MSAQKSVLFDAPGPKAKRNMAIGNAIGALAVLGVVAWVISGLAAQGQLTAAKWSPFLDPGTWQFYLIPGLLGTFQAAGVAILSSMLFGIIFGLGRLSHNGPVRWFCGLIVEFFRAVPVLLMMIFFFMLLATSGIFDPGEAPFYGVVIALTLYNGSVIAELVRSGVYGLPKGQREAASAIGMTRSQSLRNVELPQALVAMLPSIISQFVVILKDSALGYIITYPELLVNARRLGSGEGNILPALLVTAAIFIVVNFALSWIAQRSSVFLSHRAGRKVKGAEMTEIEPAAEPK
ncbi:amino acid ABC transporter permease [Arthrobacter sp. H14]|uniref:amino acid ABC transporter permease n=1 Tax=Arthrobacter sp. H14 TaxID=1312959 RepID=UPI0004B135CB|nr:amino acid ABC transporter permease [Arthrobacter sp. H14]